MKKITFVTQNLNSMCGVVRVITNWSNYFIKTRAIENVSISRYESCFYLNEKVEFTIINFKFRNKLFKLIDLIPNTIKMYIFLKNRQNTNIVFNKSLYIEPVFILKKLGLFKNINLIYFAHGGSSEFRNFYLNRELAKHRVKMIFDAFDKVICLFNDESNYPKAVKQKKLFFIENPLSFEAVNISYAKKENIVLSLGRVTKEKGIDTLIHSWHLLKDKTKLWKLQIVGDGKDKEEFKKLTKTLHINNIEFIKGTTEVKGFYEKAKIFVIPSIAEGMPMTILEAMACKSCIISTKTAGGNKLVKHGDTGLLVDIGESLKLSEAITTLIDNQKIRENLANNAFEYVKQYEIENIAKKWNDTLI